MKEERDGRQVGKKRWRRKLEEVGKKSVLGGEG